MKKLLIGLLSLCVLINTSCINDDKPEVKPDEEASMTITIKGQPTTRYVGTADVPAAETVVSNFTVFVFNFYTGDLEKMQSFNNLGGQTTQQVTGLSTGTEKRVVVFVNVPTDMSLSGISNVTDLNATNRLTLDSQNAANLSTTGLFMSGQTTEAIVLSTTGNNPVTVNVSRRVAKVILESLAITPDAAELLEVFTLSGISIQKARLNASPIGNRIPAVGEDVVNYAGGIASPEGATPNFNLTRDYLLEGITLPAGYTSGTELIPTNSQQRYFYVLPNDGANNHATLMTISGTEGTTPRDAYYPFEINGTAVEGSTNGNYIESNNVYSLSVVIRRLNLPSEDPNLVPSQVVMDVTVVPQPWEPTIEQAVEW